MTKIYKVVGFAGTGKTRWIVNRLREHIVHEGYDLNDVYFVGFSRETRATALSRLKELFPDENITTVRTFHSLCAKLLDLKNKDYITKEDRKDFMKRIHMSYSEEDEKEIDIDSGIVIADTIGGEKTVGNLFFNQYALMKVKMVPPVMAISPRDMIKWGVYREMFEEFVRKWEAYKKERNKYEYVDVLTAVLEKKLCPSAKIIAFDEAQDWAPIMFELYKMWAKSCEIVYIGGDKNQYIYEWAGANADLFLKANADEVIELKENYRLYQNQIEYIEGICNVRLNCKSMKKGKARIEEIYDIRDGVRLAKEHHEMQKRIIFNFFTNYHIYEFAKILNQHLIPYTVDRGVKQAWSLRFIGLYNSIYKVKHNELLTTGEAYSIIKELPQKAENGILVRGMKSKFENESQTVRMVPLSEFKELFTRPIKLFDLIRMQKDLSETQKNLMVKLLLYDFKPLEAKNIMVRLGTYWSVKGSEGNTTVCCSNATKQQLEDRTATKLAMLVGLSRGLERVVFWNNPFQTKNHIKPSVKSYYFV